MRVAPLFLLFGAVVLAACATLTAIPSGTCGNGVVDPGEDCDSFPATCGAPGSARACRITCDRAVAGVCGQGAGCGVDGVCRRATGELEEAGPPLSANVFTLLAGDFDSDGQTDLVGSPPFGSAGASRVHFFDRAGALAQATPVDIPTSLAVARDLDGDGLTDLGFTVRDLGVGAFGALAGRRDRTLSALLFPAFAFPKTDARVAVITASAQVTLPGDNASCLIGVSSTAQGNRFIGLCDALSVSEYSVEAPLAASEVLGQPRAGRTGLTSSPCGEVFFATNAGGAGRVYAAAPCTVTAGAADWATRADLIRYEVPGTILDLFVGPFLSLTSDSVLVKTTNDVYLLGPGSTVTAATDVPELKGLSELPLPLATGDLDGDGKLDLVLPLGILLSTPSPFASDRDAGATGGGVYQPRDGLQWASARIARMNGDDLPDVVVSYPDSLDVDILLNGGGGRFTPFSIRSNAPIRGVATGDFDGDRIADTAFLESKESGAEAELFIAYGTATGKPESPRRVGSFKHARSLAILADGTTAIDHLGVLETSEASASFTVLYGTSGRQQISPLFINDSAALAPLGGARRGRLDPVRFWAPVTLNIGALRTAGVQEVVSLATGITLNPSLQTDQERLGPFQTGVWLAGSEPGAARGALLPFKQIASVTQFVGLDETRLRAGAFELGTLTTTGDVDLPPNGVEEVVALTRTAGGVAVAVIRNADLGTTTTTTVIAGANITGGEPLELADIDGDDAKDLVVAVRLGGKLVLHTLKGDGRGGFSSPTAVELPEEPRGIASIMTGARRTEVAVVTTTKLFLHSAAGTREVEHGIDAPELTAVAAGDVDGDGVTDLAIADRGAIRLFRQRPVLK